MKHLPQNNIVDLTADTEQIKYEAEKLLDDHPKRLWKAQSGLVEETLRFDVVGGFTDIAVFGTNAATATIEVVDPDAMVWGEEITGSGTLGASELWGEEITGSGTLGDVHEWANIELDSITAVITENPTRRALWIALSELVVASAEVTLKLITDKSDTVEAGVIRAAVANSYGISAPEYGTSDGRIDYSIFNQLQNGGRYGKKRDLVKDISGQMKMTEPNWDDLSIKNDEIGRFPTAWRLTDDDNNKWIIFGYMESLVGNHTDNNNMNVSFNLIEVL